VPTAKSYLLSPITHLQNRLYRRKMHIRRQNLLLKQSSKLRQPIFDSEPQKFSEAEHQMALYAADVEGYTPNYLADLRRNFPWVLLNRRRRHFFYEKWYPEELPHSEVIRSIMHHHGYHTQQPAVSPIIDSSAWHSRTWEWLMSKLRLGIAIVSYPILGNSITGAVMTIAMINEETTRIAYLLWREVTEVPEIPATAARIAKDERLHGCFDFNEAHYILTKSWLARQVVPRLVRSNATPVGVGANGRYKGLGEFMSMSRFLYPASSIAIRFGAADRRVRSLPGCKDLDIIDQMYQAILAHNQPN
jgi:hypothetical protein